MSGMNHIPEKIDAQKNIEALQGDKEIKVDVENPKQVMPKPGDIVLDYDKAIQKVYLDIANRKVQQPLANKIATPKLNNLEALKIPFADIFKNKENKP